MLCPKCNYEWISRVKYPKECPRCKRRLDFINSKKQDKEDNKTT